MYFLHLKTSNSMLLPLLPPEVANDRTDITTTRPLNIFKTTKWSDASTVKENTKFKGGMNLNSIIPSVIEKINYNGNQRIIQSVANNPNFGFDKNRWSNNIGDLQTSESKLNGETGKQNFNSKDSTPNDIRRGLTIANDSQKSRSGQSSGFYNQDSAGTLLQSLFKTMLRNNRKSGIRKVINNFIQKLQVIVNSDSILTNSSQTPSAFDISHNMELSKKHEISLEKRDNSPNQKGDTQQPLNILKKDTKRKEDYQNLLKPTSNYQPTVNDSNSKPAVLKKEQRFLNQAKSNKQKQNIRQFRRGRRRNSSSDKISHSSVLNVISENSRNQNFEEHGLKVGLTRNFEKLYKKFFANQSAKENQHTNAKPEPHKHKKYSNNNKSGQNQREKPNDKHKSRKMLRDLAEYTYNWNRQSSKESYDQYIRVEVINQSI